MSFDCFKQPDKFDEAQRAKCRECKYLSARKIWCCKWGVDIRGDKPRGFKPGRKLVRSKPTMSDDYARAIRKLIGMGAPVVNQAEYVKRRMICLQCQPTTRCQHRGCRAKFTLANAMSICLEGKW